MTDAAPRAAAPDTPSPRAPEPKASAAAILGIPRHPVTRYRRAVVAAIAVGVMVIFAVAMMIGFGGHKPQPKAATEPDKTTTGASLAGPDFGALAKTYADPNGPIGQAPAPAVLPPADGGAAPSRAVVTQTSALSPDEQQTVEMARTARTASPFFAHGGDGPPAAAPTALAAWPLTAPQPAVTPTPTPTGLAGGQRALPASAVQNMQDLKEAFVATAENKADYVSGAYQHPVSPYEVKAGSIIPAALITALNSDLPGEIIAQVTEGVYDHATGRTLLIPQGARLVGKYDSQVAFGQSRALIVWNRIIMPDGRSVDLGVMTGADLSGASGLADKVNSHIGPMMRAIALSTAITIGGAVAENASARSSGNLVLSDAAGGVSSQASQVGQRFVDRELNRQPTIEVRPGWPLTVLVSKDLVLEPY